jgi:ankyrin repeat protein
MTTIQKPAPGELMKAIHARDAKRAELLILQGADPNESDEYDQTCLMQAICVKLPKIVEMLLERGADVNAKNSCGATPLMCDVHYKTGHLRLLIEKGAALDAKDKDGETAQDWARKGKRQEAVEILEEAHALQRRLAAARKATEAEQRRMAANYNTAVKKQSALKNLRPKVRLMP